MMRVNHAPAERKDGASTTAMPPPQNRSGILTSAVRRGIRRLSDFLSFSEYPRGVRHSGVKLRRRMPMVTEMSGSPSDPLEPPDDQALSQPPAMSPQARAFVSAVVTLGGLILAHSLRQVFTLPISWFWITLLALTAATGIATLRVPGKEISFSISDTFSIIAAILVGPAAGAVTAALDGLVLSCRMLTSRRSLPRLLFNMAFPAMATWISAEVFLRLAGPAPLEGGPAGTFRLMVLLAMFGVLDFGLTTFTVATAVALDSRARVLDVWRQHFVGLWITYFGGIFAAMLMMAVGRVSAVEVLMLIAPLPVLLYVAFRHAQDRARDQIQHLGKMNKVYVASIEALAQAVDTKDQVTHDHVRRVQAQSLRLARALSVDDPLTIEAIKAAALLHDVGKIGIPEHILNKPGRLTPSEFEVMKQHAPMGAEILSVIDFPYPVVPIVRHHHENWDGTGYPDGIAGDAIPVGARILQVVDCFDALTSDRPYRRELPKQEALQILIDRKGTMYDPYIVDVFVSLHGSDAAPVRMSAPSADAPRVAAAAPTAEPSALVQVGSPLHAFYELGRLLPAARSDEDRGEVLWRSLAPHLPPGAFVLYTVNAHATHIAPAFCSAPGLVAPDASLPIGEGLSGWVAATSTPVVNSDARLDLSDAVTACMGLATTLAVPARVDENVVAVLSFYARDAAGFTDADLRLVEAAASVIAAAHAEASDLPVRHAA
jgi:putative nucleotidyltransferase with HDIG domain